MNRTARTLHYFPERQRPGLRTLRLELGERVFVELWRERVLPKATIRNRWVLAAIAASLAVRP